MTLRELKSLLNAEAGKFLRLTLPNELNVPVSFHVTEVGCVHKTFIDCGGVVRETEVCQLQVWVGEDYDHRIETQKAAAILEKAAAFLPDDTIPVEIEYEDDVISQYLIESYESHADAVILTLGHKHTACLAPELCGIPGASSPSVDSCCGPGRCC